ncbi:hypothetical protein V2W45_1243755, partial [Cenococcum geophilum]
LILALQILSASRLLPSNSCGKKTSLNLAINAGDFDLGRVDKVYEIVTESITLSTITKPLTPPKSSPPPTASF